MAFICTDIGLISGFLTSIMGIAAMTTTALIIIGYAMGEVLHNPKLTLWAKTELGQLLISMAVTLFVYFGVQAFCQFNFGSIGDLFGYSFNPTSRSLSVYDAAHGYLTQSAGYVKDLMEVARYHLAAYNIMQLRSIWQCEEGGAINILFCLFGSAVSAGGTSGGASAGLGISPESGYGFLASGMNFAFNSLLFSYLSLLNYLFILNYALSAFAFFFLPLGIFFRAMPYLRGLGSLFMVTAIAFLFVYPGILAIFYIDINGSNVLNPDLRAKVAAFVNAEDCLADIGAGDSINPFNDDLYEEVFECGSQTGSVEVDIFALTGNAFLIGVFIPSLAMLAAMGSIAYLNRFLGQELDLSRVVQMV